MKQARTIKEMCHQIALFCLASIACITIIVLNNVVGQWVFLWQLNWPVRVFSHVCIVFLLPSTLLGTISIPYYLATPENQWSTFFHIHIPDWIAPNTLRDLVSHSRTEGLGEEVKCRILTGTYILAAEQFDAYYIQAQKVRHLISLELQETLSHVDVLLGPTTPTLAFPIGASNTNPLVSQLSDIFTVVANLVGLPAISIPIGFQENLPMGLQLIGPHFGEAMILQAAHAYQKVTDWHTKIPEGEAL